MQIGDFKIIEEIYSGKRSSVYRVQKKNSVKTLILKVFDKRNNLPSNNRIQKEFNFIQRIDSDYVIKALEYKEFPNFSIIVFNDLQTLNLKQSIHKAYSIQHFLDIAPLICLGLKSIHQQGIIHNDINPSNIIINEEKSIVKIIDFDIGTTFNFRNDTFDNPNNLEGTLPYISPEQTGRMNRTIDYRTDFYSLGVTFYEMLTGQLPFKNAGPIDMVYSHIAREPKNPSEINPNVPKKLAEIILKLMSKSADDRYQSSNGLINDLEVLKQNLDNKTFLDSYVISQKDFSGSLHLSQKLYGREQELKQLNSIFNEAKSGLNKLVFISGYSGSGKTTLVHELHGPITTSKGFFIDGKFGQFEQNTPYNAFKQAFTKFCKTILAEKKSILNTWRENIIHEIEEIAGVLTDIIPNLELIIGKQPALPQLYGQDAINRFSYAIQRFISVIATEEHPLVIFLDDLQWTDSASLKLIELLMKNKEQGHFLIIGAYRVNEVSVTHPLTATINELIAVNKDPTIINISDLTHTNIVQWLSDSFDVPAQSAELLQLTEHIYSKTQGNPFFVSQLIKNLYAEKLIYFDFNVDNWNWDIEKIKSITISDNVIDFLIRDISKMNTDTIETIKLASCIGNSFSANILTHLSPQDDIEINKHIKQSIVKNILLPLKTNEFQFAHDRLYQAVYSLIDDKDKHFIHLKIARYLRSQEKDVHVFDILRHYNIASLLLSDEKERKELAHLNLKAAIKAKDSAAHINSYGFALKAKDLLIENSWKEDYDLTLNIFKILVESSYLNGKYTEMNDFIYSIQNHSKNITDRYSVCEYKILSLNAQMLFNEAIEKVIEILSELDVDITQISQNEEAKKLQSITNEEIGELINLPQMTEQKILIAMRLIMNALGTFFFAKPELVPVVSQKTMELTLKYGYSEQASFFLSFYGSSVFIFFKNYINGNAYLKLAYDLSLSHETNNIAKVRSDVLYATYTHYFTFGINRTCNFLDKITNNALIAGDTEYAAYAIALSAMFSVNSNIELPDLYEKARKMKEKAKPLHQIVQFAWVSGVVDFCNSLLSNSIDFEVNAKKYTDIESFWDRITLSLMSLEFIHDVLFDGNGEVLKKIASNESTYNQQAIEKGGIHYNMFIFYSSLLILRRYSTSSSEEKETILQKIESNIQILNEWANFGKTFSHRFYLIKAEHLFLQDKHIEAFLFFDKAIQYAKENEFLCDEAIANECAAKAHMKQGLDKTAQMYFQEALLCYQRWGATKKVKQLEENYPKYVVPKVKTSGTVTHIDTTLGTTSTSLDISSILKASQTLSGEIQVKKLLEKVLDTIIENAGAQFGTFIQNKDGKLFVLAKGSKDESKNIILNVPLEEYNDLPSRVVNYVMRSHEPLAFENLSKDTDYIQDEYVAKENPKSAICYPVSNQGKLSALLYLENNLIEGAFTNKRLNVLNMLSTQIAISLENANLYETLEDKVNQRTKELRKANKEIKQQTNELQVKNNQLVELDNFKQAMTNMIVHDLKNPLSSIINVSENLTVKDQLEKIRQQGNKMLHIVSNVLDVQKYEETVMEVNKKNIDIFGPVEQAVQQVEYLAREKSVSIIQQPAPDVKIFADGPVTERILINILTNAIKFAPVGSAIELLIKLENDMVIFSVKDEGQGIAPKDQSLVFEKYAQVKAKKSGNIRSTGLGLTFCKIAVEAHAGEIGIISDIGKGALIWFTLPKGETDGHIKKAKEPKKGKAVHKLNYNFTADEKAMLLPVIEKLRANKLYELTNMMAALKTIDSESSETISNWCKEVVICINRFNQKRFDELIEEVVK